MEMVEEIPGWQRITLGADKGYDRKEFVRELRDHHVTPHLAQKQSSALTSAPRVMPATRSARPSASVSRRSSAGSRPSAGCARRAIAERRGSAGCFASHWPLTTWSGCATCCLHRHKATGKLRVTIPSEAIEHP